MALRESIANADEDWEERAGARPSPACRASRSRRHPKFEARHKEFHMALLAACGSPILLRFCGQLYDLNVRYRYLAGRSRILRQPRRRR